MTRNGEEPAILRSTNQGNTWTIFTEFPLPPIEWVLPETDHGGSSVYAANRESAEAGGFIFSSGDKGNTWQVLTTAGTQHWHGLYAQNWGDRAFFVSGDDLKIHYTKDSGVTTEITGEVPYQNGSYCVSFEQFGGGYITAVKENDYMYRSFDMGAHWHKDVHSGQRKWMSCKMTAYGSFDLVNVRNEGIYQDRGFALPLTEEQVGWPFRYAGPTTDENNMLMEVAISPTGTYTIAGELYWDFSFFYFVLLLFFCTINLTMCT